MGVDTYSAKTKVEQNGEQVVLEGEVTYDFGDDLDDAVSRFGEDVVFGKFRQQAVIDLQSVIRSCLTRSMDEEATQAEIDAWKPGVKRSVTRDPKAALLAAYAKLSPEEREAIKAELEARSS